MLTDATIPVPAMRRTQYGALGDECLRWRLIAGRGVRA
jgi:hypothetical protein